MSRQPRIVIPDVPYHIVLRGNNRRNLFTSNDDVAQFNYQLGRALEAGTCTLNASCPMKNHYHATVTPHDPFALSHFVKSVAQRYAQDRNSRRHASGKLFEERFYSKPITSDLQLALTTAYIELNPLKAGPSASRFAKWSTYGLHAGEPKLTRFPAKLWTPSPWYLSLGETMEERQAAYRVWFAQRKEELLTMHDVIDPFAEQREGQTLRFERPDRSSAL